VASTHILVDFGGRCWTRPALGVGPRLVFTVASQFNRPLGIFPVNKSLINGDSIRAQTLEIEDAD
jgi:hypothetical protein